MSHLVLKTEFDDGQSVEFIPETIAPLGLPELWSIKSGTTGYKLAFSATNPSINGEPQNGHGSINTTINFKESPEPFALVPGGWLPMPLAIPQRFLVDRNVVDRLKRMGKQSKSTSIGAFKWWLQLIEQGTALFSPLLYAWEGGLKRKLSFVEFVDAYNEGVSEICKSLPKCHATTYAKEHYEVAYKMMEDIAPRAKKEAEFLEIACPLISQRVKQGNEKATREKLVNAARGSGMRLNSIPFIAALSCLYDDPHGNKRSIGREVLKPSKKGIFNALSDIRSIEITAAGQVYFGNQAFSLARDQGLAALWCALLPRGESPAGEEIEFTFHLPYELFPRLDQDEIIDIQSLIKNDF